MGFNSALKEVRRKIDRTYRRNGKDKKFIHSSASEKLIERDLRRCRHKLEIILNRSRNTFRYLTLILLTWRKW